MTGNFEHCSECDCETGNAGRGEDSIYIELSDKEIGPLCEDCRDMILQKEKQQ